MADVTNKSPSATFKSFLKLGITDNQTMDGTLRVIEDAEGTTGGMKISNSAIEVDDVNIDNNEISISRPTGADLKLTPHGADGMLDISAGANAGGSGTPTAQNNWLGIKVNGVLKHIKLYDTPPGGG